ncbi:amylo-alpha-1,6-glucosidase [Rugosimonospora africana]|uniref:Amylo-alpha-1,6-glucosidase n=1 Tax=Rugosimonospora africana TaxID=556532 RepID=A0A8J3VRW4_9ACTN|nr:amylo-alpha-1,6-glucosidase [Rugosimonospora africana]GIH15808.1 hypothetical protein Raf01_39800 [Rugosimonospora africana]
MNRNAVQILDGNTFIVSDRSGDMDADAPFPTGLFSFDTRFISTWALSLNGQRLGPLTVDDLDYYHTRFFLVPGSAVAYTDSDVSIIRERTVCQDMKEVLTILNHLHTPAEFTVRLDVGADFADIFEMKSGSIRKRGATSTRVDGQCLRLCYERESFRREAAVTSSIPADIDERGMTFQIRVGPQETWTTLLEVQILGFNGSNVRESLTGRPVRSRDQLKRDLDEWLARAPRLATDNDDLLTSYRRSLVDLAALRYTPLTAVDDRSMPSAGLPWFMSIFGRDSIFTSLQALPFAPGLAASTLNVLSVTQGTKLDDFRDCEPGKILHEVRYGESAAFEEQPHSPYYGSADTSPLFVVLLDEYERWTGDVTLVRRMEWPARAALQWLREYGDARGDGYVWYAPRNTTTGLENQCWKDSWNSISYHDGRLPGFPRATCELQGYSYDAKMRGARLARLFWNDPGYADQLEREAADLKQRFNRDFWVEDGQFYALALDSDGGQVDALSSNIGHLLWSGIVDDGRVRTIAGHLLGPKLFTGWGVRTLAKGEARYNPIGYHIGTVWPFDNSFIAWGLRRYGLKDEAGQIAGGIIDATRFFDGRLPEAFGGYERELTKYPVEYPTACSPQAWSTGAIFLLIRTMLGMEPDGDRLIVDPLLPSHIGWLEVLDVPGRWGKADAFGRRADFPHVHAP